MTKIQQVVGPLKSIVTNQNNGKDTETCIQYINHISLFYSNVASPGMQTRT